MVFGACKRVIACLIVSSIACFTFCVEYLLPSGLYLKVHRNKENVVAVQLIADAKYGRDTVATHGFRHLLEHLVIKGLDTQLETEGLYLKAVTQRDLTCITIYGNPKALPTAIVAVRKILGPFHCSVEDIKKEAEVIRQESYTLQQPEGANQAWSYFFGSQYLDPLGNITSIATATPQDLNKLHRSHFAPACITLSVVTPEDPELILGKVRDSLKLSQIPSVEHKNDGEKIVISKKPYYFSPGSQAACAVSLEGLGSVETLCRLIGALVLVQNFPELRMVYTPSVYPGLVLLYGPSESYISRCVNQLFNSSHLLLGQSIELATGWVKSFLDDPERESYLRGILVTRRSGISPETLLTRIKSMSHQSLREGLKAFVLERE